MTRKGKPPGVTALVLLLVVVGGYSTGAITAVHAGKGSVPDPTGMPDTTLSGKQPTSFSGLADVEGFDDVEIHIQIASDRSATWRVRYRYELDEERTTETFERVRHNVSNPPGVFIERMRDAAQRIEQRADRSMEIQNGTVTAFESAPHGRFGIVEYRFRWVQFAATSEDGVVVRDVLDGYPLGANETLVVEWPERFQIAEVTPAPATSDGSTVRWNGPHEFEVDRPRLVLTSDGEAAFWPAVTLPVLGVLVVVTGVLVVYRVGTGRLRAVVTSSEQGEENSQETPTELLSDEERVLRLLEDNGGRMKQQELKDELGWSRTKTSNVVNDLQDAEKIEVYRLGRENTLALPGEMEI